MAGITEVNSLQPHYVCPRCKHSDFDVDRARNMPAASTCRTRFAPSAGKRIKKAGFDIPFEVFLGFERRQNAGYRPELFRRIPEQSPQVCRGDVRPRARVSARAQSPAWRCERRLSTCASMKKRTGRVLRKAERERIANGCQDVKVTTGQHPGGIVIVPKEGRHPRLHARPAPGGQARKGRRHHAFRLPRHGRPPRQAGYTRPRRSHRAAHAAGHHGARPP